VFSFFKTEWYRKKFRIPLITISLLEDIAVYLELIRIQSEALWSRYW